jgi:hypothetical protein
MIRHALPSCTVTATSGSVHGADALYGIAIRACCPSQIVLTWAIDVGWFAVMSERNSQKKVSGRSKSFERVEPSFTPLCRTSSYKDSFLDVTSLALLEHPVNFTKVMQECERRETFLPPLRDCFDARECTEASLNLRIL